MAVYICRSTECKFPCIMDNDPYGRSDDPERLVPPRKCPLFEKDPTWVKVEEGMSELAWFRVMR